MSIDEHFKVVADGEDLPICPHCGSDLTQPNSVIVEPVESYDGYVEDDVLCPQCTKRLKIKGIIISPNFSCRGEFNDLGTVEYDPNDIWASDVDNVVCRYCGADLDPDGIGDYTTTDEGPESIDEPILSCSKCGNVIPENSFYKQTSKKIGGDKNFNEGDRVKATKPLASFTGMLAEMGDEGVVMSTFVDEDGDVDDASGVWVKFDNGNSGVIFMDDIEKVASKKIAGDEENVKDYYKDCDFYIGFATRFMTDLWDEWDPETQYFNHDAVAKGINDFIKEMEEKTGVEFILDLDNEDLGTGSVDANEGLDLGELINVIKAYQETDVGKHEPDGVFISVKCGEEDWVEIYSAIEQIGHVSNILEILRIHMDMGKDDLVESSKKKIVSGGNYLVYVDANGDLIFDSNPQTSINVFNQHFAFIKDAKEDEEEVDEEEQHIHRRYHGIGSKKEAINEEDGEQYPEEKYSGEFYPELSFGMDIPYNNWEDEDMYKEYGSEIEIRKKDGTTINGPFKDWGDYVDKLGYDPIDEAMGVLEGGFYYGESAIESVNFLWADTVKENIDKLDNLAQPPFDVYLQVFLTEPSEPENTYGNSPESVGDFSESCDKECVDIVVKEYQEAFNELKLKGIKDKSGMQKFIMDRLKSVVG